MYVTSITSQFQHTFALKATISRKAGESETGDEKVPDQPLAESAADGAGNAPDARADAGTVSEPFALTSLQEILGALSLGSSAADLHLDTHEGDIKLKIKTEEQDLRFRYDAEADEMRLRIRTDDEDLRLRMDFDDQDFRLRYKTSDISLRFRFDMDDGLGRLRVKAAGNHHEDDHDDNEGGIAGVAHEVQEQIGEIVEHGALTADQVTGVKEAQDTFQVEVANLAEEAPDSEPATETGLADALQAAFDGFMETVRTVLAPEAGSNESSDLLDALAEDIAARIDSLRGEPA